MSALCYVRSTHCGVKTITKSYFFFCQTLFLQFFFFLGLLAAVCHILYMYDFDFNFEVILFFIGQLFGSRMGLDMVYMVFSYDLFARTSSFIHPIGGQNKQLQSSE